VARQPVVGRHVAQSSLTATGLRPIKESAAPVSSKQEVIDKVQFLAERESQSACSLSLSSLINIVANRSRLAVSVYMAWHGYHKLN
jgi:hypothetical protein